MLRRIGLICYDTVTALDLTGLAEVFSMANELCADSYELVMVGPALKPVRTDTGVRVLAYIAFDDVNVHVARRVHRRRQRRSG